MAKYTPNRLVDLTDTNLAPGAGTDGHLVGWDNTAGEFQLKAPASGGDPSAWNAYNAGSFSRAGAAINVTNVTITPGAGTYLCMMSGMLSSTENGTPAFLEIAANGVQVAGTQRINTIPASISATPSATDFWVGVASTGIATVTAGQAITVRLGRFAVGTAQCKEVALSIIKVAP